MGPMVTQYSYREIGLGYIAVLFLDVLCFFSDNDGKFCFMDVFFYLFYYCYVYQIGIYFY
jgi:hypothetical protein